ncbi:hypothetical protein PV325_005147 [Microctonus aethiopoides]|uniref:Tip elongation aberrant protein 1 n=1 Tax=Microctonus aethiopoides TaxID=144406 RepID=A0AA39FKU5_9HYME|nr:hypothetical protein PV325_005147 [Microctonus aethiopoides]KAK0171328.1 hypothetical protein PV328_009073 [Microctonus aethiopoides]
MWSSVTAAGTENGPAPPSRSKHSATLLGGHVYLFGGRNGNVPLKDLWRYSLGLHVNAMEKEKIEIFTRAIKAIRQLNRPLDLTARSILNYISTYIDVPEDLIKCLFSEVLIAWEDNSIAYRDKHGKYHVAEGSITPDSLRAPGCDCPDCIGGCGWCPRKDGGKRPRKKCNRCGRGRYLAPESRWEELHPSGDRPSALQEHSAVAYKDCLYVFGGELGFSAGTETPLWIYNVKTNCWRKIRAQKGCAVPRGRRGHTALVHRGQMIIYGGYQDLRGSSPELWAFHFETESWHLLSTSEAGPPPRHKHSAVLHCDSMYIYGGMTDLQERNDCWKWDVKSTTWCLLKSKPGPGPLHGHAACRLPSCMLIFGGESGGLTTNDLWRFHFGTETWDRLTISGPKPQPRAESVALAVSELVIRGSGMAENQRLKARCHKPRFPLSSSGNRVSPSEQPTRQSFLKEISKLSQINLSRLSHPNKCSYSVLSGQEDSEETSQELNSYYPFQQVDAELAESTSGMVKSRSANALARRRQKTVANSNDINKCNTENISSYDSRNSRMTREPISVPNFRSLTLPTPVLTPVEATRLVFVDPDEDSEDERRAGQATTRLIDVAEEKGDFEALHQACQPTRGESYSSHLYEAVQSPKTPCTTKIPTSASVRFADLEEGEESTSDYASIGARSPGDPLADDDWPDKKKYKQRAPTIREGQFGFCNPNYLGIEMNDDAKYAKMLNSPPDSVLEDAPGRSASQTFAELLELQEIKPRMPPKSLPLGSPSRRAVSASRAERQRAKLAANEGVTPAPLYVFLVGGKEKGQVTVFSRPVSLWKLQLASHIF